MKIYPAPEAIIPADWNISSAPFNGAAVDLDAKHMFLNLSADPQWANVRAHELAHIAYSPPIPKTLPNGVSMLTLQAVEDCRVNILATNAGVDFSAGGPTHITESAILLTKDQPKLATLLACAVFPVERSTVLSRVLALQTDKDERRIVKAIVEHVVRDLSNTPTFKTTITVAHWIDRQMKDMADRRTIADARESEYETAESKPGSRPPIARVDQELDKATRERLAAIDKLSKKTAKGKRKTGKDGEKYFGDLYIFTPWLDRKALRPHVTKTDEEGAVLRAPWRVTTDQRIFRKAKIGPKRVTILIDASSSMHLTAECIQSIVERAPASIVAAYAGNACDNTGVLRVLARVGKMSGKAKDYHFPGSNIVDVPALRWLAAQPSPRYWICDGAVTGLNDTSDERVQEDCDAIVSGARIKRIGSLGEFNALLQKKGRKL